MLCLFASLLIGNPLAATDARIVVLAAASLKKPLLEIASMEEARNPGLKVEMSFAGSNQLATQASLGAPFDVFCSADRAQMDVVVRSKKIGPRDVRPLTANRLCLFVSEKAKNRIRDLADLTQPGVRLCMAGPTVPAGAYTAEVLLRASKAFGPTWLDQVRSKVASFESNVSQVALRVEMSEVDAGFVYETDARLARKATGVEIPDKFNVSSKYYVGLAKESSNPVHAKRFIDFMLSKEGQKVFASSGFRPPK